jgi:flagellar biosynthesis repressor protein FlbT
MIIHLKKNEKLFINGAVIKLNHRGSIELLNDAQFLLAAHVMQIEEAVSPLRRLYFIIQTMIMDPLNAELTKTLYVTQSEQLSLAFRSTPYTAIIRHSDTLVNELKYFEALKHLRKNFSVDDMAYGKPAAETGKARTERAA